MADLEPAFKLLCEHEGGYVNNPKDPGGPTKYGISLRFLRRLGPLEGDIDDDNDVDANDIKKLTPQVVEHIYKKEFWDKLKLSKIISQKVANMVLGLCVNMGPHAGVLLLQQALCKLSDDIKCDGDFGPITINAVNKAYDSKLILAYKLQACAYYRSLAEKNIKAKAFLYGWLRRVNSY